MIAVNTTSPYRPDTDTDTFPTVTTNIMNFSYHHYIYVSPFLPKARSRIEELKFIFHRFAIKRDWTKSKLVSEKRRDERKATRLDNLGQGTHL
jgi:hypothetical protein